jgi:hypothetical protein
MFDDQLEAALGDRRALADLAGEVEQQQRLWGCRKLVIAAAWADAHSDVDHPDGGMLVERLIRIGPAGTPPVAEFAPQGLVGPFGTTVHSARTWVADSLTIRHRLPRLWERVVAGEIPHWKARHIAALTADLSVATAGEVDEQTSGWVAQLPWTSFLKTLDATILQVDEQAYRQREKLAAAKREVRATQSEEGLRTLIARGEAGDVALMLALYQRVAECLAEDGDEDPLPIRMSKAIGIIAQPARLTDLLARHANDPDPHQEPWEQVTAHTADETDPWADDLPPAGWETARHGNFYQPSFDEDDWWDQSRPDQPNETDAEDWPVDPPIDPEDLAWYLRGGDDVAGGDTGDQQQSSETAHGASGADGHAEDDFQLIGDPGPSDAFGPADDHGPTDDRDQADDVSAEERTAVPPSADQSAAARRCGGAGAIQQRWPTAFRPPGWRPLTPAQLAACAPTVVMHVHLTDQTLRDNHGVVRTDAGPILLEQLHRYLIQHDAKIKVYPVIDPAATASADSYEIPLRLRRAMEVRHPRSVFPHSPTISRMDLDHTPAYQQNGPPGQTGMHSLGPLARGEHRPKTVGQWRSKQPEPGTYLWRDPEGWIAITTNQGTLVLGHTDWAHQLWNGAP